MPVMSEGITRRSSNGSGAVARLSLPAQRPLSVDLYPLLRHPAHEKRVARPVSAVTTPFPYPF